MTRYSLLWAAALAVAALGTLSTAQADSYTFGSFEGFMFVRQNYPAYYGITTTSGQIHNGPTPEDGPGPNGEPPPTHYPGPGSNPYGNWDRGGPYVSTGFGDMAVNGVNSNHATFSLSTIGATDGAKAIKVVPAVFGSNTYSQHLVYELQDRQADGPGNTVGIPAQRQADFDAFQTHRYFAFDVTYNSADWVGSTGFVQLTTYYSQGQGNIALVDRFGYHNIGAFVENTADPNTALPRVPNVDTGNPNNPGIWDPVHFPGVTTRTMYWDLSSWEQENAGLPGVPSGIFWDTHQFTQDPNVVTANSGWMEFMLASVYATGYTSGAFYFDNWRFTNNPIIVEPPNGDLDDDGDIDSHDIDILWNVIRPELAGSDDPGANDDEDLNQDGFVNEKDVDYMVRHMLTAGTGRSYGDADLDGGVGGIDYTAWRLRAGTGWANGDFDGDGGVGGLDYTLWRLRPTAYPTTVGPHGSELNAVPEPAAFVLLAMGLPGLLLAARRRAGP